MNETLITLGLKIVMVGIIVLVIDFFPSYLFRRIDRKNNWVFEILSLVPTVFFIISIFILIIGFIMFVVGLVFSIF